MLDGSKAILNLLSHCLAVSFSSRLHCKKMISMLVFCKIFFQCTSEVPFIEMLYSDEQVSAASVDAIKVLASFQEGMVCSWYFVCTKLI